MNRTVKHYQVFNLKSSTGLGSIIDVRDYRNVVVSIGTSDSADLTIKCKGSIGEVNSSPNFAESSKAINNQWEYIEMVDLNDGTPYPGSIGAIFSGVDNCRLFAVNVDNLSYMTLDVVSFTAGVVTATVCGSSD